MIAPRLRRWSLALAAITLLLPATLQGAVLDRVLYVFYSPETGGAFSPQPIFERELAFEARLEALAAGEPLLDEAGFYAARHLRAALDRHIATELLSRLPAERDASLAPHPCDGSATAQTDDLARRLVLARAVLQARVGGAGNLRAAAEAEGVSEAEVARLVRREALAARYLDVMVTPMLEPSDAELREQNRAGSSPFRELPFDEARCEVRRWVIGQRLGAALQAFLQSSSARVRLRRVKT